MDIKLCLGVQSPGVHLVSSTPHLVPQPIPFNLSEISDTETSGKDTDNEAKEIWNIGTISGLIPHLQRRKAK